MREWFSGKVFQWVHGHHLVYNTCWEDPRLDRIALALKPTDKVLVITSAGCNALDYALAGAEEVHTVDVNPRQNALLELKLAGIRNLRYEDFFAMFGRGRLDRAGKVYTEMLRPSLSPWSQQYWDRWIEFFEAGNSWPFYFRGASGGLARMFNWYIDHVAKLRDWLDAILSVRTLEEQRKIYENHIHDRFWSRPVRFAVGRDALLSMAGVPQAQRRQVELYYAGGIVQFVHDCVEAVFARLPLADNYFWRVYITGQYSPDCCPEYLKPENFHRLRDSLADRIHIHTDTVQGFLEKTDVAFSRFVLLDHMDWMAGANLPLLEQEWQWVIRRAAANTRVIWRSGGLRTDFVDQARVEVNGRQRRVGELLTHHRPWAEELHQRCRVHTYASFHIADLAV
ncbi:MAG: DUF3419 family protein [Thermoguttaceae bacterium]